MDVQRKASSNSSLIEFSSKRYEYDVFLSFRGEDTRTTFTSHLYRALDKEKIKTFIDDRLEKGDKISTELIKTIKDSYISIVIFSKNYASSKWCLDELSMIMRCKKDQGQIVLPVFYDIDPSHVRKQTGSYKKAFAKYKGDSRRDQWRNDLTEAANIVGWDSQNSKTEPKLLDAIVEVVLKNLIRKYPNQRAGLVGIENSCEEIKSLLEIGSDEVKTLGIWGMGGIGKTTLAIVLYDKLSREFEGHCLVTNVREKLEKCENLCEEIFSKLSEKRNRSFEASELRWLLQRKRVFIVLDDVATQEQLEEIIYQFYPLGPGSRVIVTTRYKQIFKLDAKIYLVQKLSHHHSLELFCLTAFEKKQPKDGYEDMCEKVISYCGGIPLALKVVGASLRSKTKEVWECQLNKLRSIPDMKIQKALKLSYDDLDRSQQSIFLDIACFFKGEQTYDMFPLCELEVLVDKSLIIIGEYGHIEMHDLIQEMSYEIVRQKSIEYPRRQSRLWKHEEMINVLKRNKEYDGVEGILLDLGNLNENLNLRSDFLAKLTSLRIFKFKNYWFGFGGFNVYLPEGLDSWSNKLEYFHWDKYSLKSLPSKFCVEQLVVLRMRHSKLKKLWNGVQNLKNLKEIDLEGSRDLIDIADLSEAKKLERVNLRMCRSLHQLHPSILSNSMLKFLDLSDCSEIKRANIQSKYIRQLYLGGCSSLTEISMVSEEITELELCGTAITSFPSISSLPKLTYLYLSDCKEIEKLDLHSKFLKKLKFIRCSSLKEISVVSEEIIRFELCGSSITSFSSISSFPKLTYLDLSDCKKIERLDVHAKSLKELYLNGCSSLKKISVASDELTRLNLEGRSNLESLNVNSRSLVVLRLRGCSSLKEISVVSEEITELSLTGTAITSFSSISSLPKLTYLDLSDCKMIERLGLHLKSLRKLKLSRCSSLKEISAVSEEIIGFELCSTAITSFSSISSFPKLTYLNLIDCKEIERLDLHSKSLRELYLNGCSSLKEISVTSDELIRLDLDRMSKLESLKVNSRSFKNIYLFDCSSIKEISVTSDELTTLALEGRRKLEILNVNSRSLIRLLLKGCSSLKEISVVSEEITKLSLSGTAITSFLSISSLPKLTNLYLEDCKEIERLDLHSKSLRGLKLKGCSSLKEISVALDNLTLLDLSGTAITSFLSISSLPKLTILELKDCKEIERLDLHSKSLRALVLNGCSCLKEISVALDNITILDLSGTAITSFLSTSSLPQLTNLYLKDCKEIERLDFHSKSLTTLTLNGCSSLKEISVALDNLTKLDLSGTAITSFSSSISSLYKLKYLSLSNCRNLVSLKGFPTTLHQLRAYDCILLKTEISQGLVLQHMLQSIRHYVTGKYLFRDGYFAFPGDHVIDECQFHTTECSMSIPGSCLDMSHLCGFIYSIILSKRPISLHMLVSIYQDSVQLWHSQSNRRDNLIGTIMFSDHVMFWCQDINEFNRMSKPYDDSKEVEIKFQLNDTKNVTKGFGVFPVYATTSGFKLQISESQSIQPKEQPSTLKRRMT